MSTLLAWLVFIDAAVHEFTHIVAATLLRGQVWSVSIGTTIIYPECFSVVWPWEDGFDGGGWVVYRPLGGLFTCKIVSLSAFVFTTLFWGGLTFLILMLVAAGLLFLGAETNVVWSGFLILGWASALYIVRQMYIRCRLDFDRVCW